MAEKSPLPTTTDNRGWFRRALATVATAAIVVGLVLTAAATPL